MAYVHPPISVDELQKKLFQRAKSTPDDQFQDLYDAICREDVLQHAYLLCRARNTHASGVDGKRFSDIATYGARKWLKELELELKDQRYRPSALLRVSIQLPKGESHTTDIPTVRDEVCMTAARLVVEPTIAAWLVKKFETDQQANAALLATDDWSGALRANALKTEIYDEPDWLEHLGQVSHTSLMITLAARIADRRVLKLFALWLACPIQMDASLPGKPRLLAPGNTGHGISNDLPISPLLRHLVASNLLLQRKGDRGLRTMHTGETDRHHVLGAKLPTRQQSLRHEPFIRLGLWNTRLGRALLISLLLHSALLALQFGEPGSGLPLFGLQGENRVATISVLNATLQHNAAAKVSVLLEQVSDAPTEKQNALPTVKLIPSPTVPSEKVSRAQTMDSKEVIPVKKPKIRRRAGSVVRAVTPPKVNRTDGAVLTTKSESTWTKAVVNSAPDSEEIGRPDPIVEKQAEEDRGEKERLETLARLEAERAQIAAAAKAHEDALARQRLDEIARNEAEKLKQAAVTKATEEELARAETERQRQLAIARAKEETMARQRADELARIEAEKLKQQLEAKAAAERIARKAALEAEAAARERVAELAAQAKQVEAERILAVEKARAAQTASTALATISLPSPTPGVASQTSTGSGRDESSGSTAGAGRDLASRAFEAARSSPSGLIPRTSQETQAPRRASILGHDPKDIQLAFYGEGWRQKVERVGAMNFPQLSKNFVYDPMVVTVSINSDGSLAAVRIVKSSGHIDLDNAVRRIVEMSAPFSAFPPDMKRSFDVADITRTWVFVGDRPRINAQ